MTQAVDLSGHGPNLGYGYAMQLKPKQALHAAIWAYAGLHLLIACLAPLAAHEAHYALYARHLALSYLDHPPLAPWLQSIVLQISSADAALRVLPLSLSVAAQYLLALLTRRAYPDGSAWLPVVAVLLLQGTLVFHGSMTLSPDAPLLPLALGVVLMTLRIAEAPVAGQRPPVADWILLGVLIGLAGLSKYTAVTLAVSLLLVGLHRWGWRFLALPGLWLAGLIALALISPVLWWNWNNDWATVRFHTDYQFNDIERWSLSGFLENMAGQLLYFSPLLVIGGLAALAGRWRAQGLQIFQGGEGVLLLFVLPVLGLYLLTALESRASPHWSMLGWLMLLPVLSAWLHGIWQRSKAVRWLTFVSGAFSVALYLGMLLLIFPVGKWPDYRHPARLVLGWEAAVNRGQSILQTLPDRGFSSEPVLLARNWHHAGLIEWYARSRTMNLFHDFNPINLRTGLSDERTWGVLIYPYDSPSPRMENMARDFDCQPLESMPVHHGDSLVQIFHFYACYSRMPGSPIARR